MKIKKSSKPLIERLLSGKCYRRLDDGRLQITVTSASAAGGQSFSVGGQVLRAISAGEREFVIWLPVNVRENTLEIVHGLMLTVGDGISIEVTGPGNSAYYHVANKLLSEHPRQKQIKTTEHGND